MILGEDGVRKLRESHVAVFGLGGVGGYALEALVRAGIGELTLVDHDTVSVSNLNRQIIAVTDTVGQKKTAAAAKRAGSINPGVIIHEKDIFLLPESAKELDFSAFDYVLDCIDTVSGKIAIAEACHTFGTPLIMAMGAGNKLDPTRFEVADVSKTSVCPLAKVMRRELKKRGIEGVKAVFSKEEPVPLKGQEEDFAFSEKSAECAGKPEEGKRIPGSLSFVPSVMGLIMAGEVIKDLTGKGGL